MNACHCHIAFLPGFVNDGSYLELDPIRDAYLSTSLEISFSPSEDTGIHTLYKLQSMTAMEWLLKSIGL